MAKKLAASDQSSSPEADDSLEVLNPDITVRVSGQDVTVREYRYFEGLRIAAMAKPFLDALYAAFSRSDGAPDADDIASLIAEHEGIVMQMVAVSSGLTEQQLRELGQADGDVLTFAWWRANSAFFYPARAAARTAAKGGKHADWGDVFDSLVAAGYVRTPAELATLTARQVNLFHRKAMRRQRHERADRINDMGTAIELCFGSKQAKTFLDRLMRDSD